MTDASEARREQNRVQHAQLREAYAALSPDQRELVKAEFAKQRIGNPALSWARFLAVALPMLPA
jgi:hypothetical protein